MLIHFIKFLLRSIRRNAAYSFINIAGLAIGLATVLLITIYVLDEIRYDRFHSNSNEIYRVVSTIHSGGNDMRVAFSPTPLQKTFKSDFSEVEFATRINYFTDNDLQYKENRIKIEGIQADPDFLKMFSFESLEGNLRTALDHPNAIVITEDLAQRLFGKEPAINKIIGIGKDRQVMVTGILKNIPTNSHLQFSFITPYPDGPTNWGDFGLYNYIKIHKNASAAGLQNTLQNVFETNLQKIPYFKDFKADLHLQPLNDIHLGTSDYQMERPGKGNKQYVIIFSLMAVLVLFIACINFTNLSTARAIKRAKEIGLRKTIGAIRTQLVSQLLGESVVAAIFSMAIALVITSLLLDPFNALVQKSIPFNYESLLPVGLCFAATLLTGILSGLYPAIVLSSIKPSSLVKGFDKTSLGIGNFSKSLVVLQFTFSIIIIAGTFVVYSQLQYIRNKNLGFKKDNVLNIHNLSDDYRSFKTALLSYPGIASVTAANQHLSDVFLADQLEWPGQTPGQQVLINNLGVDYDFFETMKMEMIEGRSFSESNGSDTTALIINEEASKILGLKQPIGQQMKWGPSTYTIVGVVKDFHFRTIHEKVGPIRIALERNFYKNMMVSMNGDIDQNLKLIEKEWKKFNPGKAFEFSFLDQDFDAAYRSEAVTGTLFNYFSGLAIVIACLGLLGLSAYTVERKNKEYSIRKILGASSLQLFYGASLEHLTLVVIAFMVSLPLYQYLTRNWLDTFAYHIDLSLTPFLISGVIALFMALMTISYQLIKLVLINPSATLKSD